MSGVLSLVFLFLEIFVFFDHFIVFVALVVAARGAAVLVPVTQTDPAKLEFTRRTRHMVAAGRLFNVLSALFVWAGFCVCDDPGRVFAFSSLLDDPFFGLFAVTGGVGLNTASETKTLSTFAAHLLHQNVGVTLEAVVTTCVWAPFDVSVLVSESFT